MREEKQEGSHRAGEVEKIETPPHSLLLSPLPRRNPSPSPTQPTHHTPLPLSTIPPPLSNMRNARVEVTLNTKVATTTTTPTTTIQRRRGDDPLPETFILTSESHACNCAVHTKCCHQMK